MKALLIPVDGPPRAIDLPDGGSTRFMRSLRALIGAECVELIWITSRWEAWLDEDGIAAGKPVNQAASLVARSFGAQFSLRGTVVIVGSGKDAARSEALSSAQVDAILEKIGAPATLHPPASFSTSRDGQWPAHISGCAALPPRRPRAIASDLHYTCCAMSSYCS